MSSCPHCGLPLHADAHSSSNAGTGSSASDAPLPIVNDISTSRPVDQTDASGSTTRARGGRFGRGLAIALGAALLGVGAIAVLTPDDSSTSATEDTAQATDSQTSQPEPNNAIESGEGDQSDTAAIDTPTDDFIAVDSIADLFTSIIDGDQQWAAVYPSPLGLQVLNADGANEPAIEVAVGFEEAARFPLISDGSTSWAVDPGALGTAYLVSTQFVVIDIDREGRVGFINDSLDPPNIGESSFGAWGPGFDLPAGADVLAVPARALFVLPATGGTYEYVTNGVVPFSDDVLVAASTNSEVFERCNEQLVCELYAVTPFAPDGMTLDIDVRSRLWLSPDGDMLVVQSPTGDSQLVWLEDDEQRTLNGRVRAVDWSDDGSHAAILSDTELTVLLPDNSMASVTLPIEPVGDAVLLVSSGS